VAGLTGRLSDAAAHTNRQLDVAGAGIAQTNTRLDDMLRRLGVMNRRFGGVVDNTAGVETTIGGLRGDVQQLNKNLVDLLNAICSGPQAPPGCP
jgi:archaellum component FlaC